MNFRQLKIIFPAKILNSVAILANFFTKIVENIKEWFWIKNFVAAFTKIGKENNFFLRVSTKLKHNLNFVEYVSYM
jgi:hypothetical protein